MKKPIKKHHGQKKCGKKFCHGSKCHRPKNQSSINFDIYDLIENEIIQNQDSSVNINKLMFYTQYNKLDAIKKLKPSLELLNEKLKNKDDLIKSLNSKNIYWEDPKKEKEYTEEMMFITGERFKKNATNEQLLKLRHLLRTHEEFFEATDGIKGDIIGHIINLSNLYKRICLDIERYNYLDETKLKLYTQDPFKSIAKKIGGFAKDLFYTANATRHSSEWHSCLSEYKEKNKIDIDLNNIDELKKIFKESNKNEMAAESIYQISQIYERNNKKLHLRNFDFEDVCFDLCEMLKLTDWSSLEKNHTKIINSLIGLFKEVKTPKLV